MMATLDLTERATNHLEQEQNQFGVLGPSDPNGTCESCERCSVQASRRNWTKGLCKYCSAILLSQAMFQFSAAQEFGHTDVLFEYGAEKIEIDARTFTSFFPTRGIAKRFQTLPGFASETDADQGILPNDEIVYNVMSELKFWSGGALRPEQINNIQIRTRNRPASVPDTIVSSQSSDQPGTFDPPTNRVGRSSSSGNFHADLQWFLESTDDEAVPPLGTYAMKLNMSTDRAGIADSDPFYFIWHYGADSEDFENAVTFFDASFTEPTLPGDLDGNGQLDAADAEALVAALRANSSDLSLDLDGDNVVNTSDLEHWVSQIANTWIGDVDLDGEFSSTDMVSVFQAGRYESAGEATWRQGDWDADGQFGSSDLIMAFQDGGYEKGPRPSQTNLVPEPMSLSTTVLGMILLAAILRRRVSQS